MDLNSTHGHLTMQGKKLLLCILSLQQLNMVEKGVDGVKRNKSISLFCVVCLLGSSVKRSESIK